VNTETLFTFYLRLKKRRKWKIVIVHHAQQVLLVCVAERKTIIANENKNIKTNITDSKTKLHILFEPSVLCEQFN
jgi:hypothetical protein